MTARWYRWDGEDLELRLQVQPRASRNEIVGPHGDVLKVRITAPPVDGKANDQLIRLLAKSFAVPRNRIQLLGGSLSRSKRVRIQSPGRLIPAITPPPEL